MNALVASDYVILPVTLTYLSLEGVVNFIEAIHHINTNISTVIKHKTDILGAVINFFDLRTKMSRDVHMAIHELLNDRVYLTTIPQNVKLNEAQSKGIPIYSYDSDCAGSLSYWDFVNETKSKLEVINEQIQGSSPKRKENNSAGIRDKFNSKTARRRDGKEENKTNSLS